MVFLITVIILFIVYYSVVAIMISHSTSCCCCSSSSENDCNNNQENCSEQCNNQGNPDEDDIITMLYVCYDDVLPPYTPPLSQPDTCSVDGQNSQMDQPPPFPPQLPRQYQHRDMTSTVVNIPLVPPPPYNETQVQENEITTQNNEYRYSIPSSSSVTYYQTGEEDVSNMNYQG